MTETTEDIGDTEDGDDGPDLVSPRADDGSGSLRDTAEEAGDETEVRDLFDLDEREATELGVHLEGSMVDEPRLD
ncbi:MAG: hypothetical protein JWM40_765 [Frankiales bacterium]|nr:hypothetical protein [Frankiales bacterium]